LAAPRPRQGAGSALAAAAAAAAAAARCLLGLWCCDGRRLLPGCLLLDFDLQTSATCRTPAPAAIPMEFTEG
jgi:hypothetical protein